MYPTPRYAPGGAMPPMMPPPAGAAPAPAAPSPEMMLEQMVADYAGSRDPNLAVQIADMMVELMGMGAPAGAAPPPAGGTSMDAGMMPPPAPMGKQGMKIPAFKKNGSIKRKPGKDYLAEHRKK